MALEQVETRAFAAVCDSGGLCHLEGFSYPIVHALDSLRISAEPIQVRFRHDGPFVGLAKHLTVHGGKLTAWGEIWVSNVDYAIGKNVVASALAGNLWEVSCGTGTHALEFVGAGRTARVNGRTISGPCLIARHARLDHIAIAPEHGASDQTFCLIQGTQEYNDFGSRASLPTKDQVVRSKIQYLKSLAEADRILGEAKGPWRSPLAREAERQARVWQAAREEDRRRHYEFIDTYRDWVEAERRKPRPESAIEELERRGREREAERQRAVLAGSR
jgi:hypothetical protein